MPRRDAVRRSLRRVRRVRRPLLALIALVIVVVIGYLLDDGHHRPAPRPAHSLVRRVAAPPRIDASHTGLRALDAAGR